MTPWIAECSDPVRWLQRLALCSEPGPGGCIIWTRSLDRYGYGRFRVRVDGRPRQFSAARAAWLAHRGPIPAGYVPDHLCRVRACINVEHMEIVTVAENTRRGIWGGGSMLGCRHRDAMGPEYPCGHPRTDPNTLVRVNRRNGYTGRACRECNRIRVARHNRQRRDSLRRVRERAGR